MPEGRNPRVKKAFLALSRKSKSPISTLRDEDNATLILSLHMQGRVQSSVGCTLLTIYATAWGICFSVHFSMVFGDTRFTMSSTSLYAFLVYNGKHILCIADFGGLVGLDLNSHTMEDTKKPAKVCVYAKAQNRTALGIVHAYMQMHPSATIEDLRKVFPNSLNPDSGVKENFIYAEEEGGTSNWNGYFKSDEELISTGDGKKVAFVSMWTKPSVERIIAQASAYGITTVKLDAIDKENHNRGFYWEYVNGYLPSKSTNAKPYFWLFALLGVLVVLSALFFIF